MLRVQRLWPILLLASLSSCKPGPKIMICVSDPQASGFDCFDERTSKSSFVLYSDSDKFVAFEPTDAATLFSFCAKQ